MNRSVSVRSLVASVLLALLLMVAAFQLGLFDYFVKQRARHLAGAENEMRSTWFGIDITQYPNDLMIYQELIYKLKPDLIIETGSDHGANALYLATLLEQVNPEGKILTVDIDARHWNAAMAKFTLANKENLLKRIKFIESDSLAPACIAEMGQAAKQAKTVLVILDSLHTKDHVLKELRQYAPFVTPGSYLIVNDTVMEGFLKGEGKSAPLAAVREFLAEDGNFETDLAIERFNVSCAHSGFLKRFR